VKPKLFIAYMMIVTLPLVILGWLGARAVSQERETVKQQFRILLAEQVSDYDTDIQTVLNSWTSEWEFATWDISNADRIRANLADDGRITQFFSLDDRGMVLYPTFDTQTTDRERDFLLRTETIWTSGAIHPNQLIHSEIPEINSSSSKSFPSKKGYKAPQPQGQWYEWYWGNGLQLLYWWQSDSGLIYGVEVNRVRLLAEIIGTLPDTPGDELEQSIGVQLLNESGHLLYQWGRIDSSVPSTLSIPLSSPLGAWSLQAQMLIFHNEPPEQIFDLRTVLICLAFILLSLGLYFYRENTRELREAAQRVNFVNHVSHELKTPLTNIRMYAELLQEDIGSENEQETHRLSVILSESQRLSRLIANVLTFNRKQKSSLSLHPKPVNVDVLIRQVLEHFKSSFEHQEIRVHLKLDTNEEVNIDPDITEQIIGNLLSNVEKYARDGGTVTISSTQDPDSIDITVQDNGPGIPPSDAKAVFEPFYRVHNDLTEGVAGTGISLSIARDLARLHGGDLVLIPSEEGAHFILSLAIQGESS